MTRTPNDDRSDTKNPINPAFHHAERNRQEQLRQKMEPKPHQPVKRKDANQ